MAIEWDETVETKRRVRMLVDRRGSPASGAAPVAAAWAPGFRDATMDDLRRACEAVGLVCETRDGSEGDREDRDNLRNELQRMHDDRLACLDALSEHVSPDATADTPRMVRPSSVLVGIRALQSRLRDARSDMREHDAALEAAEARRSSEVTGLGQQLAEVVAQRDEARANVERALSILNAMPGDDIVSAARHMMDVRRRQSDEREALRYSLSTIVNESFGPQPVMTHEELLSFLEGKVKERGRDLAAAKAERDAAVERAEKAEASIAAAETEAGVSLAALALGYVRACKRLGVERDQLGIGLGRVLAERNELHTEMEKALSILNAMPGDGIVSAASHMARDTSALVARAEKAEAELRAIEDRGGALREAAAAVRADAERIRSLESDLAAARARIAELEAPFAGEPGPDQLDALWETARGGDHTRMLAIWRHGRLAILAEVATLRARIAELEAPLPEATVDELVGVYLHCLGFGFRGHPDGIRAVAERVRRERCLIARAVAGAKFLELWYDNGGAGCWHIRLTGADAGGKTGRAIPARRATAADVPAELARMLTEVGA